MFTFFRRLWAAIGLAWSPIMGDDHAHGTAPVADTLFDADYNQRKTDRCHVTIGDLIS